MRKPARKINNGGKDRVIGNFPSYKMRRMVEWDSQVERDFLFYLEFDDDVIEYHPQPIKYPYSFKNKYHNHFPDFEVVRRSTPKLKYVEVKTYSTTQKPEFIEKTAAITAAMELDGFDYAVVTDVDLRVEPLFGNLKLLYRYIWQELPPAETDSLLNDVDRIHDGILTLSDLKDLAESHGLQLVDCYAAIAKKYFEFELATHPLGPDTLLRLSQVQING
ncbi:MAG: TnsA endonuclease N-terminal domain-containing protein [Kangiella sp.]|uniref:TnsA endonuclease N-terminal domain-containing protein n=1 Tax=Methylophaga sp. TaxID=2024840 RepID=UPI001400A57F|nr:TnsA endonuclease N-terminal domain-containing protein [Methylophaga sp.]MBD3667605.1 TnsA endonuclease N-terminal domain-containing protein [Kangiella sp.]MTI62539.1 hypothetical protein [Methylophaga sp.]